MRVQRNQSCQFKPEWPSLLVAFLLVFPILVPAQIESVTRLTAHPGQYERMEFVIMLTAQWDSTPYRSEEVRLDLKLGSPSGAAMTVPAYFVHGTSGGASVWKVRFTPIEAGEYQGVGVLVNGDKHDVSAKISFAVAPTGRQGFLHAAGSWILRFDNGEAFRGVGENIAWESRSRDDSKFFRNLQENGRYNYEYMLGSLAADGGNFFRTWMCPWNLPLEWKMVSNTNRYSDDHDYFNASAIQRLDQLVDLAESLDIYLMLTLNNSGDFQGWSWQRNNYNLANGGPAATPQEFFTNPQARAQFKDRLRYLVARWGYSPHIAAWEFFNEIDNLMYGLPQRIPDDVICSWHKEMSDCLKSIDPYHHLVTTSISHRNVEGLNTIPAMDFNQRHIYGHDGHSPISTFPEVLRHDSQQYDKPYVIGESGFEWDWSRNFDDCSAGMEGDFKKALWLGLFSPTPILPMSWWWEYFDHRKMTPYIRQVRFVLDQMVRAGKGTFADVSCQWNGPPAQALAVKCGETYFALVCHDGTNAISGDISLPLKVSHKYQVQAYDPEGDVTQSLAAVRSSRKLPVTISLTTSTYTILIITPAG